MWEKSRIKIKNKIKSTPLNPPLIFPTTLSHP